MYLCNECKGEFEQPVPAWLMTGERIALCPYCSDDDLEKLEKCGICGEYIESDKDFCELCETDWGFRISELVANGPGERDGVINYMIKWVENQ